VAIRIRNNDTKEAAASDHFVAPRAEVPLLAEISAAPKFSKHETQANGSTTRYYPPQPAGSGSLSARERKATR
jgi:hypothetical protein